MRDSCRTCYNSFMPNCSGCGSSLGSWSITYNNCNNHGYQVAVVSVIDKDYPCRVYAYCRTCQFNGVFLRAICNFNVLEKKFALEEHNKMINDEKQQLMVQLEEAKGLYPMLVDDGLMGKAK